MSETSDRTVSIDDLVAIDFNDSNTGIDTDLDNEFINYTCYYDDLPDQSVSDTSPCSEVSGLDFDESTGIFNWTIAASNGRRL